MKTAYLLHRDVEAKWRPGTSERALSFVCRPLGLGVKIRSIVDPSDLQAPVSSIIGALALKVILKCGLAPLGD